MNPPTHEATARQARRRVVITGLGPITCIGKRVDGFWKGILAEKTGIGPISSFDASGFCMSVCIARFKGRAP